MLFGSDQMKFVRGYLLSSESEPELDWYVIKRDLHGDITS